MNSLSASNHDRVVCIVQEEKVRPWQAHHVCCEHSTNHNDYKLLIYFQFLHYKRMLFPVQRFFQM